jgi:hypothetical protein
MGIWEEVITNIGSLALLYTILQRECQPPLLDPFAGFYLTHHMHI